jgi:hypothetical protein
MNLVLRQGNRDMLIKRRYRSFGLHVSVAFKKTEWVQGKVPKHVPARLYFDEDADLARAPEWFDEVDEE